MHNVHNMYVVGIFTCDILFVACTGALCVHVMCNVENTIIAVFCHQSLTISPSSSVIVAVVYKKEKAVELLAYVEKS